MPFCLNMEYPRYKQGKLHACAFMCVMNSCKKMFIQLFYDETVHTYIHTHMHSIDP